MLRNYRIISEIKEGNFSLLCSYFLTQHSTIFCFVYNVLTMHCMLCVCVCTCTEKKLGANLFKHAAACYIAFQSEPTVLYLQVTHATAMK